MFLEMLRKLISKAKAWQMFLALLALPFLGYFLMASAFANVIATSEKTGTPPEVENIHSMALVVSIIGILSVAIFLGWLWSLGNGFNLLVNEKIRMDRRIFNWSSVYPIIYPVIFLVFWTLPILQEVLILILPFHLLAAASMLYNMYFVAKNLKMAENNSDAAFSDYAPSFFLIWFFPIGVWFIQPKANTMLATE